MSDAHTTKPQRNRPASVTWLSLSVFILATTHIIGVAGGLSRQDILSGLSLSVPPALLIGWQGLWGGVWLGVAIGLWRLSARMRRVALVTLPLYLVAQIGWRVLFVRGGFEQGRLPFVIGTGVLLTALALIILTRPNVRNAFRANL